MANSERSLSPALSLHAAPMSPIQTDSILPTPPGRLFPAVGCKVCRKNHPLRYCRKFKKFDVEHRLRVVIKHHYCARCLSSDHTAPRCLSSMSCGKCSKNHHTLLHDQSIDESGGRRSRGIRALMSASVQDSLRETVRDFIPAVLLQTCECWLWVEGRQIRVRALLDPCSPCNLVVSKLPLPRGNTKLNVRVGAHVEMVISSIHASSARHHLIATVVDRINLQSVTPLSFRAPTIGGRAFCSPSAVPACTWGHRII
jgi:hypothetical protein